AAFGRRVRPDLPADVVKAFAQAGIKVTSTRRWELRSVDHPAVKPLLEYKKLYRIWVAHGWSWLQDWVRDGRFRPEFLAGGTVTGRWVTHGGGALQIPKVIRRAAVADPGWRLVVADADQMEPRVLAAISRDPGLMEVAGRESDLYQAVSERAFSGDRDRAKIAVLGAVYGQTSGDGLKNLAALRRRFPKAVAYVDEAARAGEEGRLVRTWLGRTCPPAARTTDDAVEEAGIPVARDEPDPEARPWVPGYASTDARARGRFARNFVVQGSAADWALLMLAGLRRVLTGMAAELVFFQHDEVIVHCPEEETEAVTAAIREAAEQAGRIAFGQTPVRFPFTTAVVECYADAK
ncbi:bifunctional 3'-5' exonuclease/DNA polymerase, partial [Streptomyces sp. ETH9427]